VRRAPGHELMMGDHFVICSFVFVVGGVRGASSDQLDRRAGWRCGAARAALATRQTIILVKQGCIPSDLTVELCPSQQRTQTEYSLYL